MKHTEIYTSKEMENVTKGWDSWFDEGYGSMKRYLKSNKNTYTIIRKESSKSVIWYDQRYTFSRFKNDYNKMMTDRNTEKLTVMDNVEKSVILRINRNRGSIKVEVGSAVLDD